MWAAPLGEGISFLLLLCLSGYKPNQRIAGHTNVERGERRSTEAGSILPGLMQQDEAEAGSLCRIPHAAVTSQILEDIAPLATWCHMIIVSGV